MGAKDVSRRFSLQSTLIFHPNAQRVAFKDLPELSFRGGDGIKVAIIDSGVNPDVQVDERIDYTGFGSSDGIAQTHGTLVASIIRHFARKSHITSIKVTQTDKNIDFSLILRGLQEARNIGAHIVNLSIGHHNGASKCRGKCARCAEFQAFVENTGIIVVAAAGNFGHNDSTIACPAMAPDVIAVGMVDDTGHRVDRRSSRGRPGVSKPNLIAPGHVKRNQDKIQSGTSFAAPFVTGVLAAAMPSYIGNTSALLSTVYRSCMKLDSVPGHHQGHGVLDVKRFVGEMKDEKSSGDHQRQDPS